MGVNYNYSSSIPTGTGELFAFLGVFIAIFIISIIAVSVFMLIAMWKIYKKAGKEGWEAIVPIYNMVVMFQIVGINPLWVIALLIPGVNIFTGIVFGIITSFKLAKVFNKSTGFGFGILLLPIVFIPLLAFGDAEYYTNTQPVAEPVMPELVTQPEVMQQPVMGTIDPSTLASVVPTAPVVEQPVTTEVLEEPEVIENNNQNNI